MNTFKASFSFLKDFVKGRRLLIDLAKNDFKARYTANFLGITWAFVQPVITVLIFWFVFQVGFKSKPVADFPFILWLTTGMIPWFFFAESLGSASNSIHANSFLVKKIVFRVSLLPIVQIISALVIHLFFIGFLMGMFIAYGFTPTIYWLQIPYYLFCSIILVLGISWMTSAVMVFAKDVGQIIAMVIQFGFWLTPIFWSIELIPDKYQYLVKLNPMFYITDGYRDSLIHQVWVWEKIGLSIQFWIITAIFLFFGTVIFKKLRPYFADVL